MAKRFHVTRQATLHPPYAFRHGVQLAVVGGVERDDLVHIAQPSLAEDDGGGLVDARRPGHGLAARARGPSQIEQPLSMTQPKIN